MRLLNFRARLGAYAALFATCSFPAQASDFACFEPSVIQSARIHDLQVMLMVNALKCRVRQPETLRGYGNLLDQRGKELDHHSRQLEATMIEQYGLTQGQLAFHRYETAIANYHSLTEPSLRQCEEIGTYINMAGRADHAEMETLSRLATSRAIDTCLTPIGAASAQAEVAPEPPAEPALQLVDGIPTYAVPGTGPSTAPEPVERVAVLASGEVAAPTAAAAEPAAAPAAEEKLDQAILALSAAVAALSELRQKQ